MTSFVDTADLQNLLWLVIFLAVLTAALLVLLFWVHRRNNFQRMHEMEQRISELETSLFRVNEQPKDPFKIALQQHLHDLSVRMTKNEDNTHKLINQLQALSEMLGSEEAAAEPTAEAAEDQTPAGDSGITSQQMM